MSWPYVAQGLKHHLPAQRQPNEDGVGRRSWKHSDRKGPSGCAATNVSPIREDRPCAPSKHCRGHSRPYVESSAIARDPVLRGNCGWGKSDRSSELAWAGSHQELLMDIVETSRRYHK